MKAVLAAMIIWMGTSLANVVHAQVELPTPATFAQRIEAGDLEQAQAWLEAGLKPEFEGSRIGTGLMIAAWEGNFAMMKLFLAHGADINAMNSKGETALALAAWKGRQDVSKWLLDRGARINGAPRQWSPLHYAVFAGHKGLAEDLIAQGADVNARSSNGSSVLMMAIYEGNDELVKTLLEKGADRSVRNDWGDGGLEWAMRFDRLKIARMITNPQEFNIAVSEPKEKWGEARRSVSMSPELEKLLKIRAAIVERGMSPKAIDERIAAERVRIVRKEFNQQALPPRANALEITASRKNPQDQSMRMVDDGDAKSGEKRFPVPPATYSGQPKMPPKVPVKNY